MPPDKSNIEKLGHEREEKQKIFVKWKLSKHSCKTISVEGQTVPILNAEQHFPLYGVPEGQFSALTMLLTVKMHLEDCEQDCKILLVHISRSSQGIMVAVILAEINTTGSDGNLCQKKWTFKNICAKPTFMCIPPKTDKLHLHAPACPAFDEIKNQQ